jgi:hypothetical protein
MEHIPSWDKPYLARRLQSHHQQQPSQWSPRASTDRWTSQFVFCPPIDGVDNPIAKEPLVDMFINSPSLATARDTIKLYAGARYITNLEHTEDVSILQALPSILEPHSSLPLVAMS